MYKSVYGKLVLIMSSFMKNKEFGYNLYFTYGKNYEYVTDIENQMFFSSPSEMFMYIANEIRQAYENYKGTYYNGMPLMLINLQICNTDAIIRDDHPPESESDLYIFQHDKSANDLLEPKEDLLDLVTTLYHADEDE